MSHQPPRKFHIGQRVMIVLTEGLTAREHAKMVCQQGTIAADEGTYPTYSTMGPAFPPMMRRGYDVSIPNLGTSSYGDRFIIPGHWMIPLDDPDQEQTTNENVELVREQ